MAEISNKSLIAENFNNKLETHFTFYLEIKNWMDKYWTVGFILVGFYLIFIFGAQHLMKKRKRFSLQKLLVIWNFLLAGFSIYGAFQTVPEMLELLSQRNGFHQSVCTSLDYTSTWCRFWMTLFAISKAPELGDTVFIVLRKQPLIFLHWYHHITVLLYSWYSGAQYIAPARWFVSMNFSVHAVMYFYYGLRALKYPVLPKFVSVTITVLQISQMVVGVAVSLYALFVKLGNTECYIALDIIGWGLAMYGSYFYLFMQFFKKAYLDKSKKILVFENKKKD